MIRIGKYTMMYIDGNQEFRVIQRLHVTSAYSSLFVHVPESRQISLRYLQHNADSISLLQCN